MWSGPALQGPWGGAIGGEHRGHLLEGRHVPRRGGEGHGDAGANLAGSAGVTEARGTGGHATHMLGAVLHRSCAVLPAPRGACRRKSAGACGAGLALPQGTAHHAVAIGVNGLTGSGAIRSLGGRNAVLVALRAPPSVRSACDAGRGAAPVGSAERRKRWSRYQRSSATLSRMSSSARWVVAFLGAGSTTA